MAMPGPGPYASGDFSLPRAGRARFAAIGEGFNEMAAQISVWLPTMLVYLGLMFVVAMALYAVMFATILGSFAFDGAHKSKGLPAAFWVVYAIAIIVCIVANAYFLAGVSRMALRQTDRAPITVTDLFGGSDLLGKMIGVSLLVGLAATIAEMAPALVAQLVAPNNQVLYWIMAFIGFVLYGLIYCATVLVWSIVADRKVGPVEAIRLSCHLVLPQFPTIFGIIIVLFFINMVASLPCGLGLLFTIPASCLTIAIIYRDLMPGSGPHEPGVNIEMPLPPSMLPPSQLDA